MPSSTTEKHKNFRQRRVAAVTAEQAVQVFAGLPHRQREAFKLCVDFAKRNDQLPTFHKLADLMKVKSPNAAMETMAALEAKGLLERNEISRYRFARFDGISVAQLVEREEAVA